MASDIGLKTKKTYPLEKFPWRVFYRLVVTQVVLLFIALTASHLVARHFFKKQFIEQVGSQLHDSLSLLSYDLPPVLSKHWCAAHSGRISFRITVIFDDGRVFCDSEGNAEAMENHASRPEVLEARAQQYGSSIRHSTTLDHDMYYGALHVPERGLFIRAAVPLERLKKTIGVHDFWLAIILLAIAVVLVIGAIWFARRMVFPLGRLLVKTKDIVTHQDTTSLKDLRAEIPDEWLELESNIDDIKKDLAETAQKLDLERAQLETIVAAMSDAIIAVDRNEAPMFFNTRFDVLFGSDMLRVSDARLWAVIRNPELLGAFRRALQDGKASETTAIALDVRGPKEKVKRFFTVAVSPLKNERGEIVGAAGIFHDVTEMKGLEQMRIDFVANASHELRTPLTSIKGYADTILYDIKSGKSPNSEFVDAIVRNSDRLMNLVNDLLDLSAIESTDVLVKEVVNTEELTHKVLSPLEEQFRKRNQVLETRFEASTVTADARRLEQVLVNLLDNANKYTPEGARITVVWSKEAGETVLTVSDTGPGIPYEYQHRLFERFYRVDKARSREHGGTGLGLAIVKHIMQRHDGKVRVESEPGKGATFICSFPN